MSIHSSLPSNDKRRKPFTHLDGKGHRHRMRSRILDKGASVLEDYEILEMLLFYVIPRRDTKPLAKHLINHFGSFEKVCTANKEALKEQLSSEYFIYLIRFLQLIAERLSAAEIVAHPCLQRWKEIILYIDDNKPKQDTVLQNSLRVLLLNSQCYLIKDFYIKYEGKDSISILLNEAIEHHALNMVLVHYLDHSVSPTFKVKEGNFFIDLQTKALIFDIRVNQYILYADEQYISIVK